MKSITEIDAANAPPHTTPKILVTNRTTELVVHLVKSFYEKDRKKQKFHNHIPKSNHTVQYGEYLCGIYCSTVPQLP